ncbi:hypothetical protein Hdeb2414_s0009g00310841 [Helianthus debilis subsp. tardiflorus]
MPENISSIFLPPVDLNDIPEEAGLAARISLTLTRSLPALHQTLTKLTSDSIRNRPSTLIVDFFGPPSFEVAEEFNIPVYMFYMAEPLQNKKSPTYIRMVEAAKKFSMLKGILVNSFLELEPGPFKAMEEGDWCKPKVYSVGPLIRSGSENQTGEGFECLKWLDRHPVGSVLFVSFGSGGGTLSQQQLNELAFGLEKSGQRFIWVVKSPYGKSDASYFNAQSHLDPFEFLPGGFLGRVEDQGLVVSSWAPQLESWIMGLSTGLQMGLYIGLNMELGFYIGLKRGAVSKAPNNLDFVMHLDKY